MPTVTIRNLSERAVERIKAAAEHRGVSMEQEVRELLETRYGSRATVLGRIRDRWTRGPVTKATEIDGWRKGDRR